MGLSYVYLLWVFLTPTHIMLDHLDRSSPLLGQDPYTYTNNESDSENYDSNDKYLVTYTDPDKCVWVTEENIDSTKLATIEKKSCKPREGKGGDFDGTISVHELASLKGNICKILYKMIVDGLLSNSKDEGYFKRIAVRARTYMTHIIQTLNYQPRYYTPSHNKVILGSHAI
jgi:hypothetical protein